MKQTVGIYASNDWAEAKAYAEQLRKESDCTVRLRDGALFTPNQVELFDRVLVRGEFPAVMAAYPEAKAIGVEKPVADEAEPIRRGPGRPPKVS